MKRIRSEKPSQATLGAGGLQLSWKASGKRLVMVLLFGMDQNGSVTTTPVATAGSTSPTMPRITAVSASSGCMQPAR